MTSVQWGILKACGSSANHTGFEYEVKYSIKKSTEVLETGVVNSTKVIVFLKGLIPHQKYSIQIAVGDEQGILGPFTDPVIVNTPEDG